jgi:uncharacterized protein
MRFILLVMLLPLLCRAQELKRRPFLGIQMSKVDDDTKRVMGLAEARGVLLQEVFPNSTAAAAGLLKGDVLLSINGKPVNSPAEGVAIVGALAADSRFTYEFIRKGQTINGKAVIKAMPPEKHDGIEMIYTAVQTMNGLQRLIVSKPQGSGRHPVLLFIGGIGCYSLDSPFDTLRSEVQLLSTLTRAGYVCVRAEKPGVGDNRQCTPCEKMTFDNEVSGYAEAVKKIKTMDYADSASVFVFGHSMGGVMAPLVAKSQKVKGIIAYGTIGSNFIEYLAKTRRTIASSYNMSPEETDDYIRDYCECAGWYFVDGLTTEQAAARKKDCGEYLSVFDLRSRDYNRQLYALNVPGAWKSFSGKALLLYGEQDFVASKEDHRIIADAVNHYHPGHAIMQVVSGASHGMTAASSFEEARTNTGRYHPGVGEIVLNWLKSAG